MIPVSILWTQAVSFHRSPSTGKPRITPVSVGIIQGLPIGSTSGKDRNGPNYFIGPDWADRA